MYSKRLAPVIPCPAESINVIFGSVDGHTTRHRHRSKVEICHLCVRLLVLAFDFAIRDIWFEPPTEIYHAHYRVGNGHEDEDDCKNGEGGQGLSDRDVCPGAIGVLIHSDKLEEEIYHPGKVKTLLNWVSVNLMVP